jgi:hypothetical protein
VFVVVVVYFIIDPVQKLLETLSYMFLMSTYKSLSPTPTYMKCMFSAPSKAFSTTGIAVRKRESKNNVNSSQYAGIQKSFAVKLLLY